MKILDAVEFQDFKSLSDRSSSSHFSFFLCRSPSQVCVNPCAWTAAGVWAQMFATVRQAGEGKDVINVSEEWGSVQMENVFYIYSIDLYLFTFLASDTMKIMANEPLSVSTTITGLLKYWRKLKNVMILIGIWNHKNVHVCVFKEFDCPSWLPCIISSYFSYCQEENQPLNFCKSASSGCWLLTWHNICVVFQPTACRSVSTGASVWVLTSATVRPGGRACCVRSVSIPTPGKQTFRNFGILTEWTPWNKYKLI